MGRRSPKATCPDPEKPRVEWNNIPAVQGREIRWRAQSLKANPFPVCINFNVTREEKRILSEVRTRLHLARGTSIHQISAYLLRYALIDIDRVELLSRADTKYAWLEGVDQNALTLAAIARKFPVKRRRKSRAK